MTREEIANILKQLRIESGKTQIEVAKLLGRTQQIVGHWETGYSQPDADTLFKLCSIYGKTVDEAFGFKKDSIQISKEDLSLIKKYRTLDTHGRDMVDTVLDKEQKRSPENVISTIRESDPEELLAARPETTEPHTDEERLHDIQFVLTRRSKKVK
jgi:repressor LexA